MEARSLTPEEFREVISHFASGVTVITVRHEERRYGTTASTQRSYRHLTDANQWHTMAMDWSKYAIKIYRDGALVWTITDPAAIPDVPHHLAIQLDALGWFGLIEFLTFIGILLVAYVYIWRKGALEWH